MDFERCDCEDCPMRSAFDDGTMCRSCFEAKLEEFECPDDGCEVWTVAKCNHTTCTAFQASKETPEGECAVCQKNAEIAKAKKRRAKKRAAEAAFKAKEAQAEVKDAPDIKKLLSTVTSESAKAMLTKWLDDHPEASQAANSKRKQKRHAYLPGPATAVGAVGNRTAEHRKMQAMAAVIIQPQMLTSGLNDREQTNASNPASGTDTTAGAGAVSLGADCQLVATATPEWVDRARATLAIRMAVPPDGVWFYRLHNREVGSMCTGPHAS